MAESSLSPAIVNIAPHHQRVIDRLVEQFGNDPRYPALIVGGSIAKGIARPDSDVDVVIVTADDEYAQRKTTSAFHYFSADICDYEGGYAEGKYVDLQFLLDAADHGSEPARAAFVGAFPAYSHLPVLDDLLKRITTYPEDERAAKMEAFYSQMLILQWFVSEAEKRGERYLLLQSVSDLVLFSGRLLLAYNRVLYPYHKWFMHVLRHTPDKPADFMAQAEALLANPSSAAASALVDSVNSWRDWGVTFGEAITHFMEQSEWNWRDGRPPLRDW